MSGFVVSIADLPQQDGASKAVHIVAPAPANLGTEVIGVPQTSAVKIDAVLTSLQDGILVQGTIAVHLHGECVRCLQELEQDRELNFAELYLLPEVAAAQRQAGDEEAGELFLIDGVELDLESALRDAVVLDLPFQPLCSADCAGLCATCGKRLADLPADHHHEQLDPRWSALSVLLENS